MMFSFIAKHRGIWPVALVCEALGVSRSGFYAWLTKAPSNRARRDEVLTRAVRKSTSTATAPTVRGVCGTMCWRPARAAACTRSSG